MVLYPYAFQTRTDWDSSSLCWSIWNSEGSSSDHCHSNFVLVMCYHCHSSVWDLPDVPSMNLLPHQNPWLLDKQNDSSISARSCKFGNTNRHNGLEACILMSLWHANSGLSSSIAQVLGLEYGLDRLQGDTDLIWHEAQDVSGILELLTSHC